MDSLKYKTILGLETHIELKTKQKMFCGCSADYFGQEPNTHTCPVCLGLPGALPVPNKEAIVNTIMIGLALNCKINLETYFERKHYFYPDLPKGYQISQYQRPFCYDGYLDIGTKRIKIQRIHLEEDTGKLIHGLQGTDANDSFVDFNRSSVPLVEIVTEPNVEGPEEAALYLQKLQQIIRYLGLSDCDMEKGSMRCEPNISLKPLSSRTPIRDPHNSELPNYKVEVKNINSFKFVRKAIEYEVVRQSEALSKGKTLVQETRRYMESTGKTETMRTKESSEDYRYFPEPDIPPIIFEGKDIDDIRKELETKELPDDRYKKLLALKIQPDIARILVEEKGCGDAFDQIIEKEKTDAPKLAAFIVNQRKTLNTNNAGLIFKEFSKSSQKKEVNSDEMSRVIKDVIASNQKAVNEFRGGKQNAFQFLLGQCMRILGKGTDTTVVIESLKKHL